jgi:xylan 1,4-beta-xylosidase
VTAPSAGSARIAWFEQSGSQTERTEPGPATTLPAPNGVRAEVGRGHVTLRWQPVDGAAGYLVHRADGPDGPFRPIDHGGGDVLAVPTPPYPDTTGSPGRTAWYAVGSLATIESASGPLSPPIEATPALDGSASVEIRVDAGASIGPVSRPWQPVIGSEHLALLLRGPGPGGHHVGEELADAFRIVRRELGVRSVRAHAILDDALDVYREVGGRPVHDFERVDAVLDRLLATGLSPFVELSFMPRDLAADPERTVFDYRAIISPPRDPARWTDLVGHLVAHLIGRHGIEVVSAWPFEIWNEPNLRVFWTGDQSDYFRLYDASARAIRAVDDRLIVGGPATAAAGWIDDLLSYAADRSTPVDFLSTHTYGAPPLDLRPIAARFDRADLPLHWTEWGVSPRHGAAVNDSVWGAPLVARGMRSAAGRVTSLAYWVASDHFVELGEGTRLLHGGFGLLTIGNLRKPRFWAIWILEQLGTEELGVAIEGDGGGGLIEAWPNRSADGRIAIAIWNGSLDQSKTEGDAALARSVRLVVDGLASGRWRVRHRRLDLDHSNVSKAWQEIGAPEWPDEAGWARLRAADRLEDLEPPSTTSIREHRLALDFGLPMPGVSLVELFPSP